MGPEQMDVLVWCWWQLLLSSSYKVHQDGVVDCGDGGTLRIWMPICLLA